MSEIFTDYCFEFSSIVSGYTTTPHIDIRTKPVRIMWGAQVFLKSYNPPHARLASVTTSSSASEISRPLAAILSNKGLHPGLHIVKIFMFIIRTTLDVAFQIIRSAPSGVSAGTLMVIVDSPIVFPFSFSLAFTVSFPETTELVYVAFFEPSSPLKMRW